MSEENDNLGTDPSIAGYRPTFTHAQGVQLQNWFTYHPPTPEQLHQYDTIRRAAHKFAEILLGHTPPSADQSAAIRLLREAVMTANASIACGGK